MNDPQIFFPIVKKCALALESGEVFFGKSFGAEGEKYGEIVFNTSMTGYQEILSDPSYKDQIITMTYPEIGNYGMAEENMESERVHASGFVVKNHSKFITHPGSQETLSDFLIRTNTIGLEGIDTRKLTRIIRTTGAKKSFISTHDFNAKSLVRKAKESPSIEKIDLVKEVTTKKSYTWGRPESEFRVAVYDFGVKYNILRCLSKRRCYLKIFPASAPPENILEFDPDGIFLSNGPGDPAAVPYIVKNVAKLVGKRPIFGICFGHQILAQVFGAHTYKLKFGHRGANQPVKYNENQRIEITSQNHGFAVKMEGKEVEWTHINSNDGTSEGLSIPNSHVFSVQYHPEASPGPHDSLYLFDNFIRMIREFKAVHA